MRREGLINAALLLGLLVVPLWAWWAEEPFTITLATRVAIFALAGVGLNLALGVGGLAMRYFSASAAMPWESLPFTRRTTRR